MLTPGGQSQNPPVDPAVQAMQSSAWLNLTHNLAVAQTVDRLAGLLVSEGLMQLVRNVLREPGVCPQATDSQSTACGQAPQADATVPTDTAGPRQGCTTPSGTAARDADATALVGLSTTTMKDLLLRSVVNRLGDLQAINGMLSLATTDQMRQLGTPWPAGAAVEASGGVTAQPVPPTAQPAVPTAPPPAFGQAWPRMAGSVAPVPYGWPGAFLPPLPRPAAPSPLAVTPHMTLPYPGYPGAIPTGWVTGGA